MPRTPKVTTATSGTAKAMVNRDRRRFAQLIGAALLGARLSTSRAQAPAPGAWEKIVAQAKSEKTLILYSAALGQSSHGKVAKAFEATYGISVRILEARASEIRERIRTEQAAQRFVADVSHDGSTTSTLQVADGVFEPYGALPNLSALRAPFVATDLLVPVSAIVYSILVNTRLVNAASRPKSWMDLTDSRWKGKILADDMRALGGGGVLFAVLQDKLGAAFHEKLAQNQLAFTRDIRASEQRVARGEYPIWIPFSSNDIVELKGLPVEMATPVEGCPYIAYDVALLKNAPHPNAARLFMDFFLSPKAQAICAEEGLITATNTAALATLSDEVKALQTIKLLGTTDPARIQEMLKLAGEIYH
ncbi:MAG: extracellular solute-binding protein [Burkholderiaceae bacterium]